MILALPLILCVLLLSQLILAGPNWTPISKHTSTGLMSMRGGDSTDQLQFVFSDVDGTLVHYPDDLNGAIGEDEYEEINQILKLPPSSTGLRGVISSKTLELCQKLRREKNVKLVLVSGMRTSTLLKRLPFLPRADAYASEAGGRIFYPVENNPNYQGDMVTPKRYNGATDDDLIPFGLVEDMEWRSKMSNAAGIDGYTGDEFDVFKLKKINPSPIIPIQERSGTLWEFAKDLEKKGFVIDYKGYSCCFRVNLKQQVRAIIIEEDFNHLTEEDVSALGLGSSVNLGCVDFYPIESGKKNCCEYLVSKLTPFTSMKGEDLLAARAICLCDDDNDIEMAMACNKAFLPSVASFSMLTLVRENPGKLIVTEREHEGIVKSRASESALQHVLREVESSYS